MEHGVTRERNGSEESMISMNEPHHQTINYPEAWTSEQIGGKAGTQYMLSAKQLMVIDDLLDKTSCLLPQQVTQVQFDHPALQSLIEELLHP